MVERRASAPPDSRRATADCEVPIRAATSVWVRPDETRWSTKYYKKTRRRAPISLKPGSTGSWRRWSISRLQYLTNGISTSRWHASARGRPAGVHVRRRADGNGDRPTTPGDHPDGDRPERPGRPGARHLLAPAEGPHRPPRPGGRRPDRQPRRGRDPLPRSRGPRARHLPLRELPGRTLVRGHG